MRERRRALSLALTVFLCASPFVSASPQHRVPDPIEYAD
jgi:hypothetical protein